MGFCRFFFCKLAQNSNSASSADSISCEYGVLHYRTEGVYCQKCFQIWKRHANAHNFNINSGT